MEQFQLFNVNGYIGRGGYGEAQFPDADSLVAHLDYLGVERSLVWHVAARDINPLYGNKKLLEEIKPEYLNKRLFPSFVVTPACFYEEGTIDFLVSHLKDKKVRAIKITPSISRFEIRCLERILTQIEKYHPVIFWDYEYKGENVALRDLEYISLKFPKVSFVITQIMWRGFDSALDLLWRCKNIYIDTSWLHMRDTIELLVRNFGAERLLFGLGYKSHYGAAISSLIHSNTTSEEREKISHLNVEKLLNISPAKEKITPNSPILKDKNLWNRFRKGEPLVDVEIIDSHAHTPPFTRGWVFCQNDIKKDIEETIKKMSRLGVDKIILTYEPALFGPSHLYNKEGEDILSPYKDKLSGYLAYNPIYKEDISSLLDGFFKRNFFVGFKILPAYWKMPVTNPVYSDMWEYADKCKMPILIHTWDDSYNSPAMLKDIVKKYSNASFILGHSGGGTRGRLEAEELALSNNNVYLEFCGSFTTDRPFETSLSLVGKDKVIYGSDTVAHDMVWELGRYLSMPLPDEELLPGLSANIKRILSRVSIPD